MGFTRQSIIVWTLETKFLLPSPAYRRAGFTKGSPAFRGIWQRGVGGVFRIICLLNYGLTSKSHASLQKILIVHGYIPSGSGGAIGRERWERIPLSR